MLLPVIMSGGSGTRLWPMSRGSYPKQFLSLNGPLTMFQATLKRLDGIDMLPPTVICNEDHRFLVAEQLRAAGIGAGMLMLEPEGRNTAPAVALAALEAVARGEDPILLVLASDHVIEDGDVFLDMIRRGKELAEGDKFVTFGVVPSRPETGYGYIRARDGGTISAVRSFVEKPDEETARVYFESGNYYWNSGMFMFRASQYLSALEAFRPDILSACETAMDTLSRDLDFTRLDRDAFLGCPSESIDYAVMEHFCVDPTHGDKLWVVPMNAAWSDVGSWSALWDIGDRDDDGNVLLGDVLALDTSGSYIRADDKLVATVGVEDIVVVETKDAVLVAAKDRVQDVKKIVETLKSQGREEWRFHREIYRPWGKYDSVDCGDRYQVKRITVKPGEKLSVQMHHHRAEHWIVVSGTAQVRCGEEERLVTENQSVYIPVGATHYLENPGKIPLELIEVQSGSYLGEDDIVRFEDRYGRS